MNTEDFKFFTINTKSLWEKIIKNRKEEEYFSFSDNRLSLKCFKTHKFEKIIHYNFSDVQSFAVDPCGVIYFLKKDGKIFLLNPDSGYQEELEYENFNDEPMRIEVSYNHIYVLNSKKLFILTKFEKPKVKDYSKDEIIASSNGNFLEDMAIDNEENIFILSTKGQIYKKDKKNENFEIFADLSKDTTQNNKKKLSIGKHDNWIYALISPESQNKIIVHDFKETKSIIHLENIVKTGTGFAVYDKDCILLAGRDDQDNFLPTFKYNSSGQKLYLDYNSLSENIALDNSGNLYIPNIEKNGLAILRLVERFPTSHVYKSEFLDSGQKDLEWHKVVLDMNVPKNTQVDVEYRADNNVDMINDKGEKIAWKSINRSNPRDALVDAIGQYIQFRIKMASLDGINTPTIKELSVYYPRKSYLRHLPSIYQKDEKSKKFLEKFLSIYETFFLGIDKKIDSFTQYLDPNSVPDDFLPWLASWLALTIDEKWPKYKISKLIELAPTLYKNRGTKNGMEQIISLFLDEDYIKLVSNENNGMSKLQQRIQANISKLLQGSNQKFIIFENFNLDCIDVTNYKKTYSEYQKIYGTDKYSFCVIVMPFAADRKGLSVLSKIIENEKPAHTIGNAVLLQPEFYLNKQTYLDLNTVLSKRPFVMEQSSLNHDSFLGTENMRKPSKLEDASIMNPGQTARREEE